MKENMEDEKGKIQKKSEKKVFWQKIRKEDKNVASELVFQWEMTPSGKYGMDMNYEEVEQRDDSPDTFYYLYRFTVLNLVDNSTRQYTSNLGPMKFLHAFYWLSDTIGVCIDFSRRFGTIRQNILVFDHEKCQIDSPFFRTFDFRVDDTLGHNINASPLVIGGQKYFSVCGWADNFWSEICVRLIPWNPLGESKLRRESFRVRQFSPNDGTNHSLQEPQIIGHPIAYGNRLYFVCSAGKTSENTYYHSVCLEHIVSIDIDTFLSTDDPIVTQKHMDIHSLKNTGSFKIHIREKISNIISFYVSLQPYNYRICNREEQLCLWDKRIVKGCANRTVAVIDLDRKQMKSDIVDGITRSRSSFLSFANSGHLWVFGQSAKRRKWKKSGVRGWSPINSICNLKPFSLRSIAKNICLTTKNFNKFDRKMVIERF